MAGALEFGLMCELDSARKCFFYLFGIASDNDDQARRVERLSGRHDVSEHGSTTELMQNLGAPRFHARALSGGEDDNCKFSLGSFSV